MKITPTKYVRRVRVVESLDLKMEGQFYMPPPHRFPLTEDLVEVQYQCAAQLVVCEGYAPRRPCSALQGNTKQ